MSNITVVSPRRRLFAEPAGRPGDWWEPVPIAAAEVAGRLGSEAYLRRLRIDLLVALLVEHGLVLHDTSSCGIDCARARGALAAAVEVLASTGPGRLHTSYVRMLRRGERDYWRESDAEIAQRDLVLPLRLHDSALSKDLSDLCTSEFVGEAISWEIAAATDGQFMREWVLRTLLGEVASQPTFV